MGWRETQTVIVKSAIKRQKEQTASETACLWITEQAVRKLSRSDQVCFFPDTRNNVDPDISFEPNYYKNACGVLCTDSQIVSWRIRIVMLYMWKLLISGYSHLGLVPSQPEPRSCPSPSSLFGSSISRSNVPQSHRNSCATKHPRHYI